MIYLPAMDYNLPPSFGFDAEFLPRFADRCGYGKFIIGRIVVIGIFASVPAVPIVVTLFVNPFVTAVRFMIPVTVCRSMTVMMFFI